MKTVIAKAEEFANTWYVVDVTGKTLGRVASQIAAHLRGKNSPIFTPHVLMAPHMVIINADKIKVTGKKFTDKTYEHFTGYPSGLKSERFENLFARFPARILEKAVKGMLPKNALGRMAFRKLKVYAGSDHPHFAQQPQFITLQ